MIQRLRFTGEIPLSPSGKWFSLKGLANTEFPFVEEALV